MREIWKNLPKLENYYQVSTFGRVKSLDRSLVTVDGDRVQYFSKILTHSISTKGYPTICIYLRGKAYALLIHRLVAQAFIPNPENKPEVNHKDAVKTNNFVDNLEWATHKENIEHAIKLGLNPTTIRNSKAARPMPTIQFTLSGEFVREWPSIREINRILGFNTGNIYSCAKGKVKTAYGYKWRFKDEPNSKTNTGLNNGLRPNNKEKHNEKPH